jgi:hypothetical protein
MTRGTVVWLCIVALAGPQAFAQTEPVAAVTVTPGAEDPLLVQVDEAIKVNGQRYLIANYHSPWQIFHGILAYKKDLLLKIGDQKISAIEWVATSEPKFDGLPLLMVTPHGAKFHPFTREYAFEGHPSQTLALLSESHLPADYQFKIGDKTVTIADFLNNTMMEVNTREEITWVLWALTNYLKSDAQWTDQWGQPWSIEKLVDLQVAGPVVGAPCGGNHGLFALVRARDKYLKSGRQLRGVWLQADQKIKQHIEIARTLQNQDGSFSSDFYRGPGFATDAKTRFNTTGHTLEFLSAALPESRLNEPWVRNAANMLSKELIDLRKVSIDPGPLYHSINALMNYRDRAKALQTKQAAELAAEAAGSPAPLALAPVDSRPAPLVISPSDARPVPLPADKPNVYSLLDPVQIQPGRLAMESPVSALAPVNR